MIRRPPRSTLFPYRPLFRSAGQGLSMPLAAHPEAGPADMPAEGFAAVVIAEGPAERPRSTSQLVSTLLASARREVVISTPYFIPDATVLEALCAAAWRGVQVTLILPARNDSWIVGAASRSTYRYLLRAGVILHEFRPGLLHAKTLCVDGQVALVGSTNLDLRSFDLNFENKDRKSTRLNSSHLVISYAVFCLKKKKKR